MHSGALMVSEGIDRDRAVDESGNQIAVFGRRGSRPLDATDAQRLYLRDGRIYTVSNTPPSPPSPATDGVLGRLRYYWGLGTGDWGLGTRD